MSDFSHDDILPRLGRLPQDAPLYFLPCRDRLVSCRVRLNVLVAGSFHPSALAVLEALCKSTDGLSIAELADATGASDVPGRRFTSELVARLCASHHIEQLPAAPSRFQATLTSDSALRPTTEIVEHDLFFLPRSGRFAWDFKKDEVATGAKIGWWKPPDEEALYSPDALSQAIKRACTEFVKDRRNLFPSGPRIFSIEDLERDKLLIRTPELIEADIVRKSILRDMIVHRCYFYAISDSPWVRVYRAMQPVTEAGYAAYFRAAVADNPTFLDSMLAASEEVPRSHK